MLDSRKGHLVSDVWAEFVADKSPEDDPDPDIDLEIWARIVAEVSDLGEPYLRTLLGALPEGIAAELRRLALGDPSPVAPLVAITRFRRPKSR